jgi:hypothetical protein
VHTILALLLPMSQYNLGNARLRSNLHPRLRLRLRPRPRLRPPVTLILEQQ